MALGMAGLGYAAQQVAAGVVEIDTRGGGLPLAEDAVLEVGKPRTEVEFHEVRTKPHFELVPTAENHDPDFPAAYLQEVMHASDGVHVLLLLF